MAIAVADSNNRSRDVWGRQRVNVVTVTFDAAYVTGGEPFTAADVPGISEILYVAPALTTSGWLVVHDASADTLKVFGQEPANAGVGTLPLTEADNLEVLTGETVELVVIGI